MSGSTRWWVGSTLVLVGCPQKDDSAGETTPTVPATAIVAIVAPGATGWNPVRVELDDATIAAPAIETEDGSAWPVAPLTVDGEPYAWVADPVFVPGVYRVLGTATIDAHPVEAFAVDAYGVDPSFDPATVVGTTWKLRGAPWVPVPAGIGDLAWSYAGDPLVAIDAVDGDRVEFRIATHMIGSDTLGQVIHATGTLSATGDFSWSEATIDAETEPEPLHLEDLALHWGWLGDGSRAAGVEGRGVVDTRVLDPYLADGAEPALGAACDLVASFGARCRACASDGEPYCLDLRFHAGELVATDEAIPEDVDRCGVDLEKTGEGLSCDVDLSGLSCAGVVFPVGGLAGLLLVRRRRHPSAA